MHKILLLLFSLATLGAAAQSADWADSVAFRKIDKSYRYRVTFTDKKDCGYSTRRPEAFLSPKAIERRRRYGLRVDKYDLPVTPKYLKALTDLGLHIYNKSKWNNTAVIELSDTAILAEVRRLPFVNEVRCVWISPDSIPYLPLMPPRETFVTNKRDTLTNTVYGHGLEQADMLSADYLHKAGYRGAGITIAVIDGGFFNTDLVSGLAEARILGTRNFVRPGKSVYEESQVHGTMVLSCIAANAPYSLVGTAPEASFYLLQSEDSESEQLVEEDNWCAAVEYADSLGCDIVTSSLGYLTFDHPEMSHTYRELDGRTAINSRSASLAASRGILLLNSAGNSGDEAWKKIGFPADARDMLAVGAVNANRVNTTFSSVGNSADGRIKPDVMAMGGNAAVYLADGEVGTANGTSFSCPILCGAAACLVQMFPRKRPAEIIRAIRMSGHNADHPDNIFGYGIPDMVEAANLLRE